MLTNIDCQDHSLFVSFTWPVDSLIVLGGQLIHPYYSEKSVDTSLLF